MGACVRVYFCVNVRVWGGGGGGSVRACVRACVCMFSFASQGLLRGLELARLTSEQLIIHYFYLDVETQVGIRIAQCHTVTTEKPFTLFTVQSLLHSLLYKAFYTLYCTKPFTLFTVQSLEYRTLVLAKAARMLATVLAGPVLAWKAMFPDFVHISLLW